MYLPFLHFWNWKWSITHNTLIYNISLLDFNYEVSIFTCKLELSPWSTWRIKSVPVHFEYLPIYRDPPTWNSVPYHKNHSSQDNQIILLRFRAQPVQWVHRKHLDEERIALYSQHRGHFAHPTLHSTKSPFMVLTHIWYWQWVY